MSPSLAAMVFQTVQGILLIVLCFSALIIALYCLFFMVPLRQFVERINSLGGGMKGIQAHVDGVRCETEAKIKELEELTRQELSRARTELQGELQSLTESAHKVQASLQRLDQAAQSLQAELRENASDTRKLSGTLSALRAELEDLRGDFQALQGELDGTVRQLVAARCGELEGTVLRALEAVQDEMLRGTANLRVVRDSAPLARPTPARRFDSFGFKDSYRRTGGKIIAAGPLFAELDKPGQITEQEGHREVEPAPAGGEESPPPAS